LSEKVVQICASPDATEILARLATGKVSAVQVASAFCKRAAIAQQLINCLVDFFPEAALTRAQELDSYYAEHKKPVGPLHGLPISMYATETFTLAI